ncbi:MAG: hypothetical protein V1661_02930 [bacterium]
MAMRDAEKLLDETGLSEDFKKMIFSCLEKQGFDKADLFFNLRRQGFSDKFIARIISEYCALRIENKGAS